MFFVLLHLNDLPPAIIKELEKNKKKNDEKSG